MTKKERTIKACRELAAKYREPEGKLFFCWEACPLCHIHKPISMSVDNCWGCPLASTGGIIPVGCYQFKTAKNAISLVGYEYIAHNPTVGECKAFDARAAFFDKIIPILGGIPASRFTKKGWKYFDELDRRW